MKRVLPVLLAASVFSCNPVPQPVPVNVASGSHPERAIVPGKGVKGELFTFYLANGKSRWKWNWTSQLDFTGVSWNDDRTATLITPGHVVMAAHFVRPGNVAVWFHDKNGKPYERYITRVQRLKGLDVAVGKLNLSLPPEVKVYRFASEARAVPGRTVFVTDKTRVVSVHRIDHVFGRGIRFAFDPEVPNLYRRNLIAGDSGNPSFLLENGELRLLETHTSGGPGAGPNYSNPEVQAAIREAIAELDR